jgi:hypothetical protein
VHVDEVVLSVDSPLLHANFPATHGIAAGTVYVQRLSWSLVVRMDLNVALVRYVNTV